MFAALEECSDHGAITRVALCHGVPRNTLSSVANDSVAELSRVSRGSSRAVEDVEPFGCVVLVDVSGLNWESGSHHLTPLTCHLVT